MKNPSVILYRPIRRLLDESMSEVVLIKSIKDLLKIFKLKVVDKIKYVYQGTDTRINWESFLIAINGKAAGYINFPIQPKKGRQIPIMVGDKMFKKDKMVMLAFEHFKEHSKHHDRMNIKEAKEFYGLNNDDFLKLEELVFEHTLKTYDENMSELKEERDKKIKDANKIYESQYRYRHFPGFCGSNYNEIQREKFWEVRKKFTPEDDTVNKIK